MDRERLVKETALIIGWLEKHPGERTLILWQAAQEEAPGISYSASTSAAAVTIAAYREHLTRFLSAARFLPCGQCLQPAVYLPDATVLNWPEMTRHECTTMHVPARNGAATTPPRKRELLK